MSLAATRVACSAGATSGAWVGAVVSPARRRLWALVAQLPELEAHAKRGEQEHGEEDLLVARDHGWRDLRAAGVGTPFKNCGGEGGGNASLVVGVVGLRGDVLVRIAFRGDFNGKGGARHALDAR